MSRTETNRSSNTNTSVDRTNEAGNGIPSAERDGKKIGNPSTPASGTSGGSIRSSVRPRYHVDGRNLSSFEERLLHHLNAAPGQTKNDIVDALFPDCRNRGSRIKQINTSLYGMERSNLVYRNGTQEDTLKPYWFAAVPAPTAQSYTIGSGGSSPGSGGMTKSPREPSVLGLGVGMDDNGNGPVKSNGNSDNNNNNKSKMRDGKNKSSKSSGSPLRGGSHPRQQQQQANFPPGAILPGGPNAFPALGSGSPGSPSQMPVVSFSSALNPYPPSSALNPRSHAMYTRDSLPNIWGSQTNEHIFYESPTLMGRHSFAGFSSPPVYVPPPGSVAPPPTQSSGKGSDLDYNAARLGPIHPSSTTTTTTTTTTSPPLPLPSSSSSSSLPSNLSTNYKGEGKRSGSEEFSDRDAHLNNEQAGAGAGGSVSNSPRSPSVGSDGFFGGGVSLMGGGTVPVAGERSSSPVVGPINIEKSDVGNGGGQPSNGAFNSTASSSLRSSPQSSGVCSPVEQVLGGPSPAHHEISSRSLMNLLEESSSNHKSDGSHAAASAASHSAPPSPNVSASSSPALPQASSRIIPSYPYVFGNKGNSNEMNLHGSHGDAVGVAGAGMMDENILSISPLYTEVFGSKLSSNKVVMINLDNYLVQFSEILDIIRASPLFSNFLTLVFSSSKEIGHVQFPKGVVRVDCSNCASSELMMMTYTGVLLCHPDAERVKEFVVVAHDSESIVSIVSTMRKGFDLNCTSVMNPVMNLGKTLEALLQRNAESPPVIAGFLM